MSVSQLASLTAIAVAEHRQRDAERDMEEDADGDGYTGIAGNLTGPTTGLGWGTAAVNVAGGDAVAGADVVLSMRLPSSASHPFGFNSTQSNSIGATSSHDSALRPDTYTSPAATPTTAHGVRSDGLFTSWSAYNAQQQQQQNASPASGSPESTATAPSRS